MSKKTKKDVKVVARAHSRSARKAGAGLTKEYTKTISSRPPANSAARPPEPEVDLDNLAPLPSPSRPVGPWVTPAAPAAHSDPRKPIRDYLYGLRWDGKSRIPALMRALGVIQGQLAAIELMRDWMVYAVRNLAQPGVPALSAIPVMVGPQGIGKSRALDILSGGHVVQSQVGDPEFSNNQYRAWIVELVGLTRESVSALKTLWNKYAEQGGERILPFAAFFISLNDESVARKLDGSRRFGLLYLTESLDLIWLKDHRDELWAEAVALSGVAEQLAAR